jgi:hypothetical protein
METRCGEILIAVMCGIFGVLLILGSVGSLISGEVSLRRYDAPLSEAWPITLILGVLGLILTVFSIVAIVRMVRVES